MVVGLKKQQTNISTMSFSQINQDLYYVKSGKEQQVRFPITGKVKIEDVEPSCDCIDYKVKTDGIEVIWKPKEVPVHLKVNGKYSTQKALTVTYTTPEQTTPQVIVLLFRAIITD